MYKTFTQLLGRLHSASVMERRIRRLADTISRLLPENSTILDVGAGNGKLSFQILCRRPDLTIEGVDVVSWPEQHIRIARFDGCKIPAGDSQWDYCLVSDVLHHCEDPGALLDEMHRVAKKGILIKDHIAESTFDRILLTGMDWLGNSGHGIPLTYEYWSWVKWSQEFTRLGLREKMVVNSLNLYPFPANLLLDRNLHFVGLLAKDE